MIRALLLTVALTAAWAAEPVPTMLFELVRDQTVIAALRVPLTGGTSAQDVPDLGRLSVTCPAPITAGDGAVVYREVAIDLAEPGDRVALTTSVSASFAKGGVRKVIGNCARGQFTVTFPE